MKEQLDREGHLAYHFLKNVNAFFHIYLSLIVIKYIGLVWSSESSID